MLCPAQHINAMEDISLIRNLPNFELFSPSDHHTAGALVDFCLDNAGPKYLRLDADHCVRSEIVWQRHSPRWL